MARMTTEEKKKDRARKIEALTDAAMEWLKKHRNPWQVVDETPAETLHLAQIMAQFAADTRLTRCCATMTTRRMRRSGAMRHGLKIVEGNND